jgi:hydrogenase maturation protease
MTGRLTIIGCGNLNRCDDGVGVVIARRLQAAVGREAEDRVRVFDAGTAGMDVMFQSRGCESLIIVDASATGSAPGTVFEVPGEELENAGCASFSLHDFRWDHALYAGRQIFKDEFPEDVRVTLIEAENLGYGWELSAPVAAAAERVTAKLLSEVGSRLGQH